jgi:hypothetical protein
VAAPGDPVTEVLQAWGRTALSSAVRPTKQFYWPRLTREAVMTNTEDVQRYADAIMAMIKEDQDTGQLPRNVCSWDELDESVDAGDYYRLARMPSGTPDAIALRNAVNEEIGQRLAGASGGSRSG